MTKAEKYISLAEHISTFSSCKRSHFGVVIVRDDVVLGIGYNGPARNVLHCEVCRRANDPSGVGYEKCIAVHAEVNAVIQSGGREKCLGATLYVASHNKPVGETDYNSTIVGLFMCNNCARIVVNAGIKNVVQEEKAGIKQYEIQSLVSERKLC